MCMYTRKFTLQVWWKSQAAEKNDGGIWSLKDTGNKVHILIQNNLFEWVQDYLKNERIRVSFA